jgi:hypothetical protein
MRFRTCHVWPELSFAIGLDEQSGRCFLSIPVSNRLVDYEEYYAIDQGAFDLYARNPAAAAFVARCRARQADELLILPPGRDRGVA